MKFHSSLSKNENSHALPVQVLNVFMIFIPCKRQRLSRLDPLLDQLVSRKNNYRLWFNDVSFTSSPFDTNYQGVLNSLEIENAVTTMWVYLKFGLQEEKEHLNSINEIVNIISSKNDN